MKPTTRATLQSSLGIVAGFFFIFAAGAFLFGGGLIHALGTTDRVLSEIESIGVALLFGALGGRAKIAEDRLEDSGQPESATTLRAACNSATSERPQLGIFVQEFPTGRQVSTRRTA